MSCEFCRYNLYAKSSGRWAVWHIRVDAVVPIRSDWPPPSGRLTARCESGLRRRATLLKPKTTLSKSMTLTQFDNGYWYATELREFAKTVGLPSGSTLRKDELEKVIKGFLESGKIQSPTRRSPSASGARDAERGLNLNLAIAIYRNDRATWHFIEREAEKLAPGLKRKSGARYRLNRWREAQIEKGRKLTYGDLVSEYVRLSQTTGPFAQIPQVRYVNFLSDFFASEKGATREKALRAWAQVKKLDAPKNYRSWVNFTKSRRVAGP
jgi:hypothetical protein